MTTTSICALRRYGRVLSRNPARKNSSAWEFIGPFGSAPAILLLRWQNCPVGPSLDVLCDDLPISLPTSPSGVSLPDGIHVMNNAVTGTAFVSYQNPQQRDCTYPNSARFVLLPSTLIRICKRANHLHIAGLMVVLVRMIDVMRKAITTIKSAGNTVSFDPNIRKRCWAFLKWRRLVI